MVAQMVLPERAAAALVAVVAEAQEQLIPVAVAVLVATEVFWVETVGQELSLSAIPTPIQMPHRQLDRRHLQIRAAIKFTPSPEQGAFAGNGTLCSTQ